MKIVFAGPSIHGVSADFRGIALRPPAVQGDLLGAMREGANVLGLIDGAFEATASVWHKEILFALSEGVAVVGGASMGALRAAECAFFGMEAVGEIAQLLLSGECDDDALVAITHGPAELAYPPLTEALVDCEATIAEMAHTGAISLGDAERARQVARSMHYKIRTISNLADAVNPGNPLEFEVAYAKHRISIKTRDALAVIDRVRLLGDVRERRDRAWRLNQPPLWRETVRAAHQVGSRRTR